MNKKDMLDLAFYMTRSEDKIIQHRDLYYDPSKKIFMHSPANSKTHLATSRTNGKSKQEWVNGLCVFIGRYSVDVNPFWIFEDMKHV